MSSIEPNSLQIKNYLRMRQKAIFFNLIRLNDKSLNVEQNKKAEKTERGEKTSH